MSWARRGTLLLTVILGVVAGIARRPEGRRAARAAEAVAATSDVERRIATYGTAVARRLAPGFAAAGVAYPPRDLAFLAFKDVARFEIYARDADQPWRRVRTYPILAASGVLGPKLKEGDRQVPEGVYGVDFLNPNSRFHLSVRIDYPNADDRRRAKVDGRTNLGGDIMIHGDAVSAGCLAMGDPAAEDVFVLTALVGKERVKVVVGPTDFRRTTMTVLPSRPSWVGELYAEIRAALAEFPVDG